MVAWTINTGTELNIMGVKELVDFVSGRFGINEDDTVIEEWRGVGRACLLKIWMNKVGRKEMVEQIFFGAKLRYDSKFNVRVVNLVCIIMVLGLMNIKVVDLVFKAVKNRIMKKGGG